MADQIKYLLSEKDIPTHWYNLNSDFPEPLPPVLHPGTGQPIGPDDLAPLFPMALIGQEVSADREIEIPEQVRDILRQWRPSPLFRARRLEKVLDTPAKIFYKYEGVSPAGSHKPNTAVAQVYYNKMEGTERITTETGAGQWGSSLSMACQFFDIECKVFMVRCSYDQKPYRRAMIETFGGTVIASPSKETEIGKAILAKTPDTPGSLGIAISEAIEACVGDEKTKYSLGSVLNHVMHHQTVIGQETMKQLAMADEEPDIVIGCAGGGSNLAGLAFPYIGQNIRGDGKKSRIIAVEPSACPTLTKGKYTYDFGDTGHMTPLLKMHTLGNTFIPPGIHAGGLRYHGMGPMVSHAVKLGLIEATSVQQLEAFGAGVQFARAEGIIPAPESNHAIAVAVSEALKCKKEGSAKTIVFNLSGHGHFDMLAYTDFLSGQLKDYDYPEEEVAMALAGLPSVGS